MPSKSPILCEEPHRHHVQLPMNARDCANMFQFYAEYSDRFTGDLGLVRELNPELKSVSDWLGEHRKQLKAAIN